jgi:hypothetical protein
MQWSLPEYLGMLQTSVDVADDLVGSDFSLRGAVHILNRSLGDLQALQFLLRDCVGNGPHVALDFLFAESCTGHRFSQDSR